MSNYKISDELCDFIGVPRGTKKSRTDIICYINAYVKEHNLNKPTNRRIILPDDKLKNILKINNDEEVTFFILQRLISHHFSNSKKLEYIKMIIQEIPDLSYYEIKKLINKCSLIYLEWNDE